MRVVADAFEEEGDVVGDALVADALDPGLLEIVDAAPLEGGVVEEDLDAVGSGFLEAADAPDVEEVGEAAGGGGVVAGLLVGEQEALAVAVFRGGQAELGVEEDGGGVFGEDGGDEGLEDFEVVGVGGGSALLGEGLASKPSVNKLATDHAEAYVVAFASRYPKASALGLLRVRSRRSFYTVRDMFGISGDYRLVFCWGEGLTPIYTDDTD